MNKTIIILLLTMNILGNCQCVIPNKYEYIRIDSTSNNGKRYHQNGNCVTLYTNNEIMQNYEPEYSSFKRASYVSNGLLYSGGVLPMIWMFQFAFGALRGEVNQEYVFCNKYTLIGTTTLLMAGAIYVPAVTYNRLDILVGKHNAAIQMTIPLETMSN